MLRALLQERANQSLLQHATHLLVVLRLAPEQIGRHVVRQSRREDLRPRESSGHRHRRIGQASHRDRAGQARPSLQPQHDQCAPAPCPQRTQCQHEPRQNEEDNHRCRSIQHAKPQRPIDCPGHPRHQPLAEMPAEHDDRGDAAHRIQFCQLAEAARRTGRRQIAPRHSSVRGLTSHARRLPRPVARHPPRADADRSGHGQWPMPAQQFPADGQRRPRDGAVRWPR